MGKINTAKELFDEMVKICKPNTIRPELGEFTTLKVYNKENKVEFTINWDREFLISFNPKTIGVKIKIKSKEDSKEKTLSKQLPLNQKDLLSTILDMYVNLCK